MITAERFAALALALDDATAAPHMERVAFRTPLRIYATLAADGASANIKLSRELRIGKIGPLLGPRSSLPSRTSAR